MEQAIKFIDKRISDFKTEKALQIEYKKSASKKVHWSYDLLVSVIDSKIELLDEVKAKLI